MFNKIGSPLAVLLCQDSEALLEIKKERGSFVVVALLQKAECEIKRST